jgi:hypothetical protein
MMAITTSSSTSVNARPVRFSGETLVRAIEYPPSIKGQYKTKRRFCRTFLAKVRSASSSPNTKDWRSTPAFKHWLSPQHDCRSMLGHTLQLQKAKPRFPEITRQEFRKQKIFLFSQEFCPPDFELIGHWLHDLPGVHFALPREA